ncbi:hypothetical protein BH24ACI2_BH24ACI2_09510 [soil metagenome]
MNEAFVINAETKARLIAEDARSAELIKPFLAGRDIKRYESPKAEKFLILMPKGWTRKMMRGRDEKEISYLEQNTQTITVILPPLLPQQQAWNWLKENYSAIAKHLEPFSAAGEKRFDKGEFWWELRACDYYDEFEKPKMLLPDISLRGNFQYDDKNFYCVNTAYMISSDDKFLLGLLNSNLITFIYKNLSSTYRGGYLRFIYQYLIQLPIRTIDFTNPKEKVAHDKMVELVEKMLDAKKSLADAQTDKDKQFYERFCESLDKQIDNLVYDLYEITNEERKIIES